jgi:hypothetical protein
VTRCAARGGSSPSFKVQDSMMHIIERHRELDGIAGVKVT